MPTSKTTMFEDHEGLGDTLHIIFKSIGISYIVNKLNNGEECGCTSRRQWLNEKVPWNLETLKSIIKAFIFRNRK